MEFVVFSLITLMNDIRSMTIDANSKQAFNTKHVLWLENIMYIVHTLELYVASICRENEEEKIEN